MAPVLLLFMHLFGASLRCTVMSNSYCPFYVCVGREEAADTEVLKLRKEQVENVLESMGGKAEAGYGWLMI